MCLQRFSSFQINCLHSYAWHFKTLSKCFKYSVFNHFEHILKQSPIYVAVSFVYLTNYPPCWIRQKCNSGWFTHFWLRLNAACFAFWTNWLSLHGRRYQSEAVLKTQSVSVPSQTHSSGFVCVLHVSSKTPAEAKRRSVPPLLQLACRVCCCLTAASQCFLKKKKNWTESCSGFCLIIDPFTYFPTSAQT